MEMPDWLNTQYMQTTLQTYYKDSELIIKKCDIQLALGKGENFGGIVMRAHIDFQTKATDNHKSYIIKTSFEGDAFAKEKMDPYDIFRREMAIYEHVLPKLNGLMLEIQDNDKLFATAVRVDYEHECLIFEDLGASGYIMADRTQGLDIQHLHMILQKLAKMHATSAVLNEREHGCLETFDRGFFNRHTDSYSSFFIGALQACSRLIRQLPDCARYAKQLSDLMPHYMEIGKCCFEPTPGHVNVLAHGDMWTNNVMFKYDVATGQPLDVILIDFQYSFWGSPTLDLHYLFNTSLKEDMRLYRQDTLFQYYHGIFTQTLCKLGYHANAIPSLYRFNLHVEQKRWFAFHSSCIIQPVMLNEATEDADFNALMGDDERSITFRNTLYKNKAVQQNLKQLLPIFDKRGLLDTNQCA